MTMFDYSILFIVEPELIIFEAASAWETFGDVSCNVTFGNKQNQSVLPRTENRIGRQKFTCGRIITVK